MFLAVGMLGACDAPMPAGTFEPCGEDGACPAGLVCVTEEVMAAEPQMPEGWLNQCTPVCDSQDDCQFRGVSCDYCSPGRDMCMFWGCL